MANPERTSAARGQREVTRPGSTRSRLLASAFELLVQDGYQATTVQGVARRAGLTTGAIYANFANKQELMAIAVLERWAQTGSVLIAETGLTEGVGSGAVAQLAAYLVGHLASPAAPEHRLLAEVTGAVLRDSGASSPLFAGVQALEVLVTDVVEKAKADGTMSDHLTTEAIVAVIVSLYLGSITSKSWGLDQPERDEVADVIAAAMRGFGLGPEEAKGG